MNTLVAAPLSPRGPSAAAADLARLLSGGAAEALVVGATRTGLVRILLDSLPVTLALPADAPIAAGDRIALRRTEAAAIELVKLAPGEAAQPSLFERGQGRAVAAAVVTGPAAQAELALKTAGVAPGDGTARNTAPPAAAGARPAPGEQLSPAGSVAVARPILAAMAAAAIAGQRPLPELFARLQALATGQDHIWPPAIRASIQDVLASRFDPETPAPAQALRRAIEQSGVFMEGAMVQHGSPEVARGDLKAALLALRGLLSSHVAAQPPASGSVEPAAPLPSPAPVDNRPAQALPASSLPAGAQSETAKAIAQFAAANPTFDLVRPRAPVVAPYLIPLESHETARADAPPLKADELRALLQSVLRQGAREQPTPPAAAAADLVRRADDKSVARPPLRGELQPLQIAEPPREEALRDVREQAAQLLKNVDASLDRVRLLQFASLNDGVYAEATATRQWQVEAPLALPQGAAALPLMIEREGGGQNGGYASGEEPTWRMRFTTETPELGAIDVAVSLRNGRIDVRFWADRAETQGMIDAARDELATRLESGAAPVDAIRCQAGRRAAPRQPASVSGRFMDVQS